VVKAEGCDKLRIKAWRVASVIESVDTDVTELCRLLPLTDAEEMLVTSEPKVMGG